MIGTETRSQLREFEFVAYFFKYGKLAACRDVVKDFRELCRRRCQRRCVMFSDALLASRRFANYSWLVSRAVAANATRRICLIESVRSNRFFFTTVRAKYARESLTIKSRVVSINWILQFWEPCWHDPTGVISWANWKFLYRRSVPHQGR